MSVAGRLQAIMDLYQTEVYDENGEFVGYEPTGLITKEDVKKLLDMPSLNKEDK